MIKQESSVLSVQNLKVHFPIRKGIFGKVSGYVKAVDGVSFDLPSKKVLALVGESGCGKTTVAHSILGLQKYNSGTIKLSVGKWKENPISWNELANNEKKDIRKHIQVIFQDPYSSLNPRMTIRQIIEEPLILHSVENRDARISELIQQVGLSRSYFNRYPHEFSGGQRQRICIARAIATKPELIIADEPVSALDVSIQAQIINLLDDLRKEYNQSMLFISHDLSVVKHLADFVAVMYLGKIVEFGLNEDIYNSPQHPYTNLLLNSIPIPGKGRSVKNKNPIINTEKDLSLAPKCPFYFRCPERKDICINKSPELKNITDNHFSSCHIN